MADGIVLVDKPSGPTSARVVQALRRAHGLRSVGHLGTLDPLATGLLPLCVGSGTKIAQFLAAEHKAYEGTIRLGRATDTGDVTGRTVEERPVPRLGGGELEELARRFLGPGQQIPPMYSAVKVDGRELYKRARAGEVVERRPRPIRIDSLSLEPAAGDRLSFSVRCSKGTYVRVLAEEIGRALGTAATLESLRRTEFGAFRIDQARPLAELLAPGAELPLIEPRAALRGAREIPVPPRLAFAIAAGQRGALTELEAPGPGERLAVVLAPDGGVLAVLSARGGGWRLRRVLMPEATRLYRPGGQW